jgi:hypothetical protein
MVVVLFEPIEHKYTFVLDDGRLVEAKTTGSTFVDDFCACIGVPVPNENWGDVNFYVSDTDVRRLAEFLDDASTSPRHRFVHIENAILPKGPVGAWFLLCIYAHKTLPKKNLMKILTHHPILYHVIVAYATCIKTTDYRQLDDLLTRFLAQVDQPAIERIRELNPNTEPGTALHEVMETVLDGSRKLRIPYNKTVDTHDIVRRMIVGRNPEALLWDLKDLVLAEKGRKAVQDLCDMHNLKVKDVEPRVGIPSYLIAGSPDLILEDNSGREVIVDHKRVKAISLKKWRFQLGYYRKVREMMGFPQSDKCYVLRYNVADAVVEVIPIDLSDVMPLGKTKWEEYLYSRVYPMTYINVIDYMMNFFANRLC